MKNYSNYRGRLQGSHHVFVMPGPERNVLDKPGGVFLNADPMN